MGKWDHRRSRRFFRRQRSPVPRPIFYDIHAPLPEFTQDGIPLWEKKYCTLIGSVPWQKIVDSKKYIYSHSNVLNWNDSAAEESFHNSKSRYWARINSLSCDITLPDPNMYVDRIDWNPYIDPELIQEIDSAYFPVPGDEQENAVQFKRAKISVNDENPWECTGTPPSSSRALDNKAEGSSQGDCDVSDSSNVDNTDNPWERNITHGNGGSKDNPWEGGLVKSRGWNDGSDHNNRSGDWSSGCSPWGNNRNGIVSQKDDGWGKVRDSSWCQQQSNNLVNISNSWECKFSQQNVIIPGKSGWRHNGSNVSGWRNNGVNAEVSSSWQSRGKYAARTSWNHSFQKREGCNQHTFGHNGSHYQRDDRHTDHNWRWETSKKRDFAH